MLNLDKGVIDTVFGSSDQDESASHMQRLANRDHRLSFRKLQTNDYKRSNTANASEDEQHQCQHTAPVSIRVGDHGPPRSGATHLRNDGLGS